MHIPLATQKEADALFIPLCFLLERNVYHWSFRYTLKWPCVSLIHQTTVQKLASSKREASCGLAVPLRQPHKRKDQDGQVHSSPFFLQWKEMLPPVQSPVTTHTPSAVSRSLKSPCHPSQKLATWAPAPETKQPLCSQKESVSRKM